MGGKNRIFLTHPTEFEVLEDVNPGLVFSLNFDGKERSEKASVLKMDRFVDLSTAFLQKHFSEDIVPKVENAATELTSVPRGEGSHSDSDMESKVADKQDTIQFGPKRTIAEIISAGRKGKRRRSKRPR